MSVNSPFRPGQRVRLTIRLEPGRLWGLLGTGALIAGLVAATTFFIPFGYGAWEVWPTAEGTLADQALYIISAGVETAESVPRLVAIRRTSQTILAVLGGLIILLRNLPEISVTGEVER